MKHAAWICAALATLLAAAIVLLFGLFAAAAMALSSFRVVANSALLSVLDLAQHSSQRHACRRERRIPRDGRQYAGWGADSSLSAAPMLGTRGSGLSKRSRRGMPSVAVNVR
ncbi:exported hypothetical protein [Cupriavidus taiwanensis]|nr:exported hypothetical protein [Cupriavidus taiwanensis]